MQDLKITENALQDNYNNEPVFYCKNCLSLKIMAFDNNDYCDDCGSTIIESAHIDSWKELYKEKYGREFLI